MKKFEQLPVIPVYNVKSMYDSLSKTGVRILSLVNPEHLIPIPKSSLFEYLPIEFDPEVLIDSPSVRLLLEKADPGQMGSIRV